MDRGNENTLGEWSDGDDDWVWDVPENEWSDSDHQKGRGKKRRSSELDNDSDDVSSNLPPQEENFYAIENVRQVKSKKFRTTAMDYSVRFNNAAADFDLIESYERTQKIFEHLLNDITNGMNEEDQVRFVLRSTQLETPISLPFMSVQQLTPERVFSQIERVVQSNRDFRLNDTVVVDLVHVEAPQGSGRKKRDLIDLKEFLHKKKSIINIQNKDDLCLARALVVAIAKIEKDPEYKNLADSRRKAQEEKAKELHWSANVPFGPCGIPEVKKFQEYLTDYAINIVSLDHNNSIIYPPSPSASDVKPIYLYLHHNHYDVITTMPGFLSKSYFCHKCRRSYDQTINHLCPGMCKSCRAYECKVDDPMGCDQCGRMFRSKACYDRHKEPIGRGKSVCEGIKRCEKCGKSMNIRNLKNHLCQGKCKTCQQTLEDGVEHKCYIQKSVQSEESRYNELLFFDFECTQEDGIHKPNLCIIHNEAGDEWLFQGKNTNENFCKWLFTAEHKDCIVIAHNFQGYDGYFIQNYLNGNGVKYEVILRGAKILSMTVPMFNIKFIDSLNFIPMSLDKFPKTFGMDELCKGYFPHLFNRTENENYVGPIPPETYYSPNSMKPEARKTFLAWHKEQKDNNYVFNFKEEIIKYCRSDVDILRKCCLEFREMLRGVTDIDPFEKCLTIASACHEVYRTNFLEKDTIAVFPPDRYLKMKQSNLAVKWLSYTMEENNIHIDHVRNGGEKRVGKYSLDGYCEEWHTAYEFQGCFWHGKLCEKIFNY